MKRKFRGLITKPGAQNDKWAYGHLLNERSIGEVGKGLSFYKYVEVRPETIGMYSTRKDINGRRICEGDTLRYKFCGGIKRWCRDLKDKAEVDKEFEKSMKDIKTAEGRVEIYQDSFYFNGAFHSFYFHQLTNDLRLFKRTEYSRGRSEEELFDFEVIGNIYQITDINLGEKLFEF